MANIQNNVIMNWKIINQPLGMGDLSGGYAPRKKNLAPLAIAGIMAGISALTSAGSTIAGGAMSAAANNKARAQLAGERAANKAEQRRNEFEAWTDTAKGQNIMRKLRETVNQIWKKEQGAAAVAGATDSSKQMAKDAALKTVGDAVADITANDQERRDAKDDKYRAQDKAYAQQQIALDQQDALNKAQATSQMVSAIGNAASSYLGASMGTGSPGGGGVTSTETENALNNMAATPKSTGSTTTTNVPPTPEAQTYLQAGMQASKQIPNYNSSYNTLIGSPDFQRMMYERGYYRKKS